MFSSSEVILYPEMCAEERASLQRGMNFRLSTKHSVILMSRRRNAPYHDRIEDDGRVLIYEGHDAPKSAENPNPKTTDQPGRYPTGGLTQNGRFREAAEAYKAGRRDPEIVRVYEKLHQGIWVYNGLFELTDCWCEDSEGRNVFKFRLEVIDTADREDDGEAQARVDDEHLEHNRVIPTEVKLAVWTRDGGHCVQCGSTDNLHFDHIIPFSRGGSSLLTENIQILCARHNLEKRDRIQ